MELLTGKNKEQFEKWLNNYLSSDEYGNQISTVASHKRQIIEFYEFKFEMQIGVLLNYYDSLGNDIDVIKHKVNYEWSVYFAQSTGMCKSRNEAYQEAFKKADEIINKL